MATKAKNEEVPEDKKEVLESLKKVVEKTKETKFDEIKREIMEHAESKGEVAKNITVTDNYLVTAKFYDSDGREVRSYSRKLED